MILEIIFVLQIDRQMYGFIQQLEVMTNNIHEDFIDSYTRNWMDNKKEAGLYDESQHAGSLGPGKTLARMIIFQLYCLMLLEEQEVLLFVFVKNTLI